MSPLPGTKWLHHGLELYLLRPWSWSCAGLLAGGLSAVCAHADWIGQGADCLLLPWWMATLLNMARSLHQDNRMAPVTACFELEPIWRALVELGGLWLAVRFLWLAGLDLFAAPAPAFARQLPVPATLPAPAAALLLAFGFMVHWFATVIVVMEAASPLEAVRICICNLHAHLPAFLIAFGLPGLIWCLAARAGSQGAGYSLTELLLQGALVTPLLATTTWAVYADLTETQ